MRFLKAPHSRKLIFIQKLTKWVGFFLFVLIFFSISTANATPTFQEFKNDLSSSNHLKLIVIVDPEHVNPKGRFVLYVKVEVSEGWHIYSLDANGGKEDSLATKITLNSGSFIPQGSWEGPTPATVWDGALEKVVKTHDKTVEFRRWYRGAKSLSPGFHIVKGSIAFRACNNKICNLPNKIFFKTKINVLGGGG